MIPPKILVVDDEPDLEILMKQNFRRKIRAGELEFVFAQNGFQALDRLKEHLDVSMVLSDINMPEMDGLTLLDSVSEKYPMIRTVIVSAYGDMKNLRTAMNNGAFDFVNKPIDFTDLEATVTKTLNEIKNLKNAEQNRLKLQSVQRELQIGQTIQKSFLPSFIPKAEGWEIAKIFTPAKEVAGDFFDVYELPTPNKIGFVVADVCGKGVGPALFMTLIRSLMRAFGEFGSFTEKEAEKTITLTHNYVIRNHESANMFATVFIGTVDTKTGKIEYVNCGHNPPYVIRNNKIIAELDITDPVVGLFPNDEFHTNEITLEPGDSLFLFTDGVTDIINPRNELFGDERLRSFLEKDITSAEDTLKQLNAALYEHMQTADQFDDITMLMLKRNN